jgi:hypothetical protein
VSSLPNQRDEDVVFPFGKHCGKTLGQIVADDAAYLDWIEDKCTSDRLRDAVRRMCEKYAAEIDKAIEEREWRRS